MARVTVEDCLAQVPNRFALTILASRRARALLENRGTPQVACDNKQAVTALREISAGNVRFVESVDGTLLSFIEEQRSKLRASNNDNTYLEAVAFGGIEGDEDGVDDVGGDVEELTADLERLGTKNAEKTDDDDTAVDVNAESAVDTGDDLLGDEDDAGADDDDDDDDEDDDDDDDDDDDAEAD